MQPCELQDADILQNRAFKLDSDFHTRLHLNAAQEATMLFLCQLKLRGDVRTPLPGFHLSPLRGV